MNSQRSLLAVIVLLLSLGFAMTAQAGSRLYEGTLIIHAFGNDTTTGASTTAPFSTNVPAGIPGAGGHCNTKAFHARETKTFPTYYNTDTYPGPGNFNYNTFTIPSYGVHVASVYLKNAPYPRTRNAPVSVPV